MGVGRKGNGTTALVLMDGDRTPLSVVTAPANEHEVGHIERLLDAVLTREQYEWDDVLEEGCAGDPELRREVGALLARVTTARRFLDGRPSRAAAAALAEVQDLESAAMSPTVARAPLAPPRPPSGRRE